jgi:hypothetical protein
MGSAAVRFSSLGLASFAGGSDLSEKALGCGARPSRVSTDFGRPLRDFLGDLPQGEKGFRRITRETHLRTLRLAGSPLKRAVQAIQTLLGGALGGDRRN